MTARYYVSLENTIRNRCKKPRREIARSRADSAIDRRSWPKRSTHVCELPKQKHSLTALSRRMLVGPSIFQRQLNSHSFQRFARSTVWSATFFGVWSLSLNRDCSRYRCIGAPSVTRLLVKALARLRCTRTHSNKSETGRSAGCGCDVSCQENATRRKTVAARGAWKIVEREGRCVRETRSSIAAKPWHRVQLSHEQRVPAGL